MVPPAIRASPKTVRHYAKAPSAAFPAQQRSALSTAAGGALSRLAAGSCSPQPSGRVAAGSSTSALRHASTATRSVRAVHPAHLPQPRRSSFYSSASHQSDGAGVASSSSSADEDDGRHHHIFSAASSMHYSSAQSAFSIASSDLTIATRSLSTLAQVPDIAARLIGPVNKDLRKDVILNARLPDRRSIPGTGEPVETDFATAATVQADSRLFSSPPPSSAAPQSTATASSPASSAVLANTTHEEESSSASSVSQPECSLTHIELTDDHIRVVFDRACEDYSRWAALASPYAQIPADRIPEWLVPVDALNLTCVGGGCTILLERSRLRSHLLSNGGRPDLFIASEEDNRQAAPAPKAVGKKALGGRATTGKPPSSSREKSTSEKPQKKQQNASSSYRK